MQRDWRDPRDCTNWLVTLSPLGAELRRRLAQAPKRPTISFYRPGQGPCWTEYGLEMPFSQVTDQEIMDLLDAARSDLEPASRLGRPH